MLADDGASLPIEDAKKYARRNGMVFLHGNEVVDAYLEFTS
jgi:3,4-dihydroxy-2-butanone 4-phosphate synthase